MSGIAFIADQLLGTSVIPSSAQPVTPSPFGPPPRKRVRTTPPKRRGRAGGGVSDAWGAFAGVVLAGEEMRGYSFGRPE